VHADAENDVGSDLEIYAYPGEYPAADGRGAPHEGKSMAKIRLEALQADEAAKGSPATSDCPRLIPGHCFDAG
jgi:uncharacterized protein involved in type VI secretion and phage assembly